MTEETPTWGDNVTVLEGFQEKANDPGELDKHRLLLCETLDELVYAQDNFPPFRNLHEGWAKLYEECDELWELVRAKQISRDPEAVRTECIQVAAMAIRIVFDLDDGRYRQL